MLIRLGSIKFGGCDANVRQTVEALADLDRLERLTDRLLSARDWTELLADGS